MMIQVRGRAFRVREGAYDSFWQEVASQTWEPETFRLLEHFIDSQHSFVDVGAWIGPTVLYGSQTARITYALEPDPVAYAELAANVELNQPRLANVRVLNQALAPASGKIRLGTPTRAGDSSATMLARPTRQAWDAEAIRWDDLVRVQAIADCNFIKMDIEGGEYRVIPTMTAWLQKFRPTLYLSLHPPQLFWSGLRIWRAVPALRRAYVANQTAKLFDALAFYPYRFTAHGEPITRAELMTRAARLENLAVVFSERTANELTTPLL